MAADAQVCTRAARWTRVAGFAFSSTIGDRRGRAWFRIAELRLLIPLGVLGLGAPQRLCAIIGTPATRVVDAIPDIMAYGSPPPQHC